MERRVCSYIPATSRENNVKSGVSVLPEERLVLCTVSILGLLRLVRLSSTLSQQYCQYSFEWIKAPVGLRKNTIPSFIYGFCFIIVMLLLIRSRVTERNVLFSGRPTAPSTLPTITTV